MRRKISLSVEDLGVESFATVGNDAEKRGTVKGNSWTDDRLSYCCEPSASGTWPCLCNSDAGHGTCDTTCNPDQCECGSRPCGTAFCG